LFDKRHWGSGRSASNESHHRICLKESLPILRPGMLLQLRQTLNHSNNIIIRFLMKLFEPANMTIIDDSIIFLILPV